MNNLFKKKAMNLPLNVRSAPGTFATIRTNCILGNNRFF